MRLPHIMLIAATAALSACSPSDFFLGDDNRPVAKPLPQITSNIHSQVLWTQHPGDGSNGLGLALQPDGNGQNVYIATADGHVVGYDQQTGQIRFDHDLGQNITAGIRLVDNHLLLATRAGNLFALSADDGHVEWRAHSDAAILARPAAANGIVVIRTQDGTILAYDLHNGMRLWQYHLSEPTLSLRGYAEPIMVDGIVVITADSGNVVILNQQNGLPIGEQQIAIGKGYNDVQRLADIDATGKISQGILFDSAYQVSTFALNLHNGQLLWVQNQASGAQSPALTDGQLFLHNNIDHVFALSQHDGEIQWRNTQLEGRALSPMVAVSGMVGSVDNEGYLHWFDTRNGQIIGQQRIGSTGSPSEAFVGEHAVVWQLADGDVVAVRPQ